MQGLQVQHSCTAATGGSYCWLYLDSLILHTINLSPACCPPCLLPSYNRLDVMAAAHHKCERPCWPACACLPARLPPALPSLPLPQLANRLADGCADGLAAARSKAKRRHDKAMATLVDNQARRR